MTGGSPAALAATIVLLTAVLVVAARAEPAAVPGARLGRRVELVELIRAEQVRTAALQSRAADLAAEVQAVAAPAGANASLVALRAQVDALAPAAGTTGIRGPGLAVTLDDSQRDGADSGDLNDLVIHEQDLQGVINALWAGGAEAITVNGQRVLATTAIRCVGNTLLLHGAVYSPPYVVRAVGDPAALRAGVLDDPAVAPLRAAVDRFGVGFEVTDETRLLLPPYDGPTTLDVARPAGTAR